MTFDLPRCHMTKVVFFSLLSACNLFLSEMPECLSYTLSPFLLVEFSIENMSKILKSCPEHKSHSLFC